MAKWMMALRSSLASALGLALVALGVQAGAPDVPKAVAASRPPLWAEGEMPEYPGALEYPLGDGMAVNGVPIRLSYLQAKVDSETLREHYLRALIQRGLAPHASPGMGGGWTVTAMTEDGRAEIVIAILGKGPRESLVFPAMVPFGTSADAGRGVLDDLPLSPAATAAWTVTSNDKPGEAVVTYQEPDRPAGATAAFIRDELGRRGFELVEFRAPAGGRAEWTVEGRRGARRARLGVAAWPRAELGATVTAQVSNGP